MNEKERFILHEKWDKCPYRNNKCPLDIPLDEEACCDNDYENCFIFTKLYANEIYDMLTGGEI